MMYGFPCGMTMALSPAIDAVCGSAQVMHSDEVRS